MKLPYKTVNGSHVFIKIEDKKAPAEVSCAIKFSVEETPQIELSFLLTDQQWFLDYLRSCVKEKRKVKVYNDYTNETYFETYAKLISVEAKIRLEDHVVVKCVFK